MPEPHPKLAEDTADLVVHNARVVTPSGSIDRGGLSVRNGRILAVADEQQIGAFIGESTEVLDAEGRILAPGLVNSHCHAGNSLFRGLVENLSLEAWLEQVWIAETAVLTPATTELGALLGLAENLLAGVTSVFDMFWFPEGAAEAATKLGMRVTTGGIFFDGEGIDGKPAARRTADARHFCETYEANPLVTPSLNPHGTYTVGPELLEKVARLADETGALVTIHAAETVREQQTIQERYGTSVIRHLNRLGLLGPKTVLAHCVHIDDEELALLASTRTTVAHNPVSNLKLGSGVAPVPRMLESGVRVTLGTDGPISGNDMDPWLGMRLAAILHKGAQMDPLLISARTAFDLATIRGAEALGLEAGSLEAGKLADFILLRTDRAHATPLFDPVSHLVFSAGRADVSDVFVGGQQVVRDGHLTRVDLPEVCKEVNAMAPLIAASLERES